MPKNTGYVGGGMNRPRGPTHDNPTVLPNSYKDSPTKTPAIGQKANRHGFSRNPKQDSPGRMKSEAFPTSVDAAGTRGPKGDGGLARNQVVGGGGKAKEYDYGEPDRRNMKDTPSA